MPMKGSGGSELREIDRFEGGVGWIAYPEETMQRASHALVGDDGVWLVDPVDADDLDDLLAELGEVAGVAVLLDRHGRDASAIAERHGVDVHRPAWMANVDSKIDAPPGVSIRDAGRQLGDSDYRVEKLTDRMGWREAVAFHPDSGTLVVPESLGGSSYFRASGERVGVHPMLRLFPPRALAGYDAERLLVGHGEGLLADAAAAVRDAIDGSRRRAPGLYFDTVRRAFS
jgi:hypothetical protein